MEFKFQHKIGVKELGKVTGRPHLALVDNVEKNYEDIGAYFKHKNFSIFVNGQYAGSGTRDGRSVKIVYTDIIKIFKLEEGDYVSISLNTEAEKIKGANFPMYVEIPPEKFEAHKNKLRDRGLI